MKLLSIGQHVYDTLSKDTELSSKVEGKIYPLVTDKTNYPFIVFSRGQVSPDYSKGGQADGAFVNEEISVVAATYLESVSIAEAVIAALDGVEASYDGYEVDWAQLDGADEGYTNDAFVQILTFRFHINSKE